MDAQPAPDPDARELLAATLRDPFADLPATHVRDWFRYLMDRFPLWAFQPREFAKLHAPGPPLTYPLARFVESIQADEVITIGTVVLGPLHATVDPRRRGLAEGATVVADWDKDTSGIRLLADGPPTFLPEDVSVLPQDDLPETLRYDYLGKQILWYAEELQFAFSDRQRDRIKDYLNNFLRETQAKLPAHPPQKGPPAAVLRALKTQGEELIGLCWDILRGEQFDISHTTTEILADHAAMETRAWAARLALPVFSCPEILALQAQSEEKWEKGSGAYPTPKKFVIWVLAHRLDLAELDEIEALVYKASARTIKSYFSVPEDPEKPKGPRKPIANPIDSFVPPASTVCL